MSLQYDYDAPPFPLYEELEVSPRASDPVIRAAYGRLMRVHSADAGKIERLKKAFDVLSNPVNRTAYDAMGIEGGPPPKPEVRYLRRQGERDEGGGPGIAEMLRVNQIGVVVALSVLSGLVGGLEVMRVLASRGLLP
jgi:curved DNA-binding protein CbpA